jgi:hypothetical protein
MPDHFNVLGAVHRLSRSLGAAVPPSAISALFDKRRLGDDLCHIVGGRRLIPSDYLPSIPEALLRRQPFREELREVPFVD